MPPTCPTSLGRSRAKSGRDLAEPQDVCLECLCFRVLAAMGEVLTEWVGGGDPPQGVSIRRPPKVVRSVLNHNQDLYHQILGIQL